MRLVAYLLVMGCLALSPLSLFASTFTGGYEGNIWTDARNWSPEGVPGPGDEAVVPENKQAVVNGQISIGSLILGGTLFGDGNPASSLTINTGFSWTNGSIGVTVYVGNGCAGLWQGTLGLGANLFNHGEITVSADVYINYAILKNEETGVLNLTDGHKFQIINNPAILDNYGTIRRTGIGDVFQILLGGHVNHPGSQTLVEAGELYASGLDNHAPIHVLGGAVFHSYDFRVYNGTTFTGGGKLKSTGNGMQMSNTDLITVDLAETELNSQGIKGSGPLTFNQHLDWKGGTLFAQITFAAGSITDINPGNGKGITNTTTNYGTIQVNDSFGFDTGRLDNYGTLNLNGGYANYIYHASEGIHNYGLVQKPAGSAGTYNMAVPLYNESGSQLLVQSDELFCNSNLFNAGSILVGAGATLRSGYTEARNGGTFGGPGTFIIQPNGFNAVASSVSLDFSEITLNGSINGTGAVILTGHVNWLQGDFAAPVTIATGSVVEMNPGGNHGITGTTTNNGALHINTSFTLSAGQIQNNGLLSLNGPHTIGIYYGTPGIFNHGTVIRPAIAAGTYTAGVPLTNYSDGSVIVESGELYVASEFTNAGLLSVSAGAVFRTNRTVVQDGAAFTGAGTYTIFYNGLSAENTANVTFNIAETRWLSSFSGTGLLTFSGHISWEGGDVSCPVTLATGSVLDISGGVHGIGSTLTSNGTINANTGFYGGTVVNYGILNLAGSVSAYSTIYNAGTLVKNAGGDGTIYFLNNTGTIQALGNNLFLEGLTNAGAIDISAGANVQLNGYNTNALETGSDINGDGTFTLAAPLEVHADGNIDVQTFVLAGGYYGLGGTGALTFTHVMEWQSGSIGNTVILATGSMLNINGFDFKNLSGTLTNNGTVNCASDLDISSGAVINNNGIFHLLDGALFGSYYAYDSNDFNNTGTLDKTSATDLIFNTYLHNLTGGSVSINNGSMEAGKLDNAGSIAIASETTLTVKGGSNLSGGTVFGTGLLRIAGNGWDLAGTLVIGSLTLEINGNLSSSTGATLEVQSLATWFSGDLSVPVNIASGGVFNTEGYGSRYLSAPLTNNGTFHSNGSWYTESAVTNNHQLFVSGDGGFSGFSGPGFTNSSTGLLHIQGNPYTIYLYIPVLNDGSIVVEEGRLYLQSGLTHNGALTIQNGALLQLGGNDVFNNGSTVSGGGKLEVTNALTLNTALVFAGEQFSLYGDLRGPEDLTILSDMQWQYGDIETDVDIAPGATLEIGGYGGGGGGETFAQVQATPQTSKPGLQIHDAGKSSIAPMAKSYYGKTLYAALTNNGTTTQEGGYDMDNGSFTNNNLFLAYYGGIGNEGNGGVLTNLGDWQLDGSFECYADAINNGIIKGNGTLTFEPELENNGAVAPGFSPGQLSFAHNYENGSQLTMEIESSAGPGIGHDFIQANDNLILSGALTVTETGAVLNGSYTLLRCDGSPDCRTGVFASTSIPDGYVLSYTGNSVVVSKGQPAQISPADTTICSGNTVTLTAPEAASYLWSTGETTQSILVYPYYATSNYYVTVTYEGGGGALGSATVHVSPLPYVFVDPYYVGICQGQSATLSVYGEEGPYTYLWSNGETTQTVTVSPTEFTFYTVTVTNASGCQADTYAYVAVGGELTTLTVTGIPAAICESESPIELPYHLDGYYGEWSGPGVYYNYFYPNGLSGEQVLTFTPYEGQCALPATWTINVAAYITYYADADADGYGDASVFQTSCAQPEGYVSNGADCNDADAAIHPGAAETCNGTDDNCDGETDENTGTIWYADADGDGYGNAAVSQTACTQPQGYVSTDGDCNDNNAGAHPGATEICNGADDDCDGQTDEDGVCDGDGDGYTVAQGDCNDASAAIHPGATESCNNVDDDCDGLTDESNLALSLSAGTITCAGDATTLTATATGGATPYTYSLDGGAFVTANAFTIAAGSHSVTIKDGKNCTISQSITVTQPAALVIDPIVVTHAACGGGNTGAVDITVTGGSPGYTYHWSNNKTTQDLVNVSANTYTVTVTDAHGCTTVASAIVNPKLALTLSKTNVVCNGGADGTATANPTGGTPGYTYLWSNGATTQTISNLTPGAYSVTVTDALGCARTKSISVGQPSAISVTGVVQNVTCNGAANGALNISHNNGTAPFTYAWSDGATTMDRTNLAPGTYTVTVTDINGCNRSKSFTITEPAALALSFTVHQVTCNGAADGRIITTATGGVKFPTSATCNDERYCYTWSNGATSRNLDNLSPGIYTLTLTDANGCTATNSVTITQPDALEITGVGIAPLPNGKYQLTVMSTGGTLPHKYRRIPGGGYQTSNLFTNVPAGAYQVVVRDNNLCTDTVTISVPGGVIMLGSANEDADTVVEDADGAMPALFPNPAVDEVNLKLPARFKDGLIRVFDLSGRMMLEEQLQPDTHLHQFNASDWQAGIYLVVIHTDTEKQTLRLVITGK